MKSFKWNWIKQRKQSDNVPAAIANLLLWQKVAVTIDEIRSIVKSHPDFPGLLSITETLPEWGIVPEAVKGDMADLSEIDFPSIAYLKSEKFIVLKEIKQGAIYVIDPQKGHVSYDLDSFSRMWSGVLVRISQKKSIREGNHFFNRWKGILSHVRNVLIGFGLPLLSVATFFSLLSQGEYISITLPSAIIKLMGLFFCAVMVSMSLSDAQWLKKVCRKGKRIDCKKVMNSPGGTPLGIPMADLGLIYFSGGLLALLLSTLFNNEGSCLLFLSFLALLTLPYTVFSLYYQAFVLRSWCWLCLIVQLLFWLEFIYLYPYFSLSDIPLALKSLLSVMLGFLLSALVWLGLKPLLSRASRAKECEWEVKRYRKNPDYLQMQIINSPRYNMGTFDDEIEIGPKDAGVCITLVLNPLCDFCVKAYLQMKTLIDIGYPNIKGRIRFMVNWEEVSGNTDKLLDYEVASRIVSYAALGSNELAIRALEEWLDTKRHHSTEKFVEKWKRNHPKQQDLSRDAVDKILRNHYDWCHGASIVATPTTFLNDRKLPLDIQIINLKYLLLRMMEKE